VSQRAAGAFMHPSSRSLLFKFLSDPYKKLSDFTI
jgi:hypothetical protein